MRFDCRTQRVPGTQTTRSVVQINVRTLSAGLLILAAPLISLADDRDAATRAMQTSLNALRGHSEFSIRYEGTRTQSSRTDDIIVTLGFQFTRNPGERPLARLESMVFINGRLVRRYVGDGQFFVDYDPASNTYWSQRYGAVDAETQNPNHLPALIELFRSRTDGAANLVARSLSDIYRTARWTPYFSTGTVTALPDGYRVTAPAPNDALMDYVMDSGVYTGFRFNQNRIISGTPWNDQGTAVFVPGELFPDVQFSFTPPPGSRPVTTGSTPF